ncbi:MAG: nuclear transport factor 2 family protein [Actinomycetes bacterium]
MRHADANAVASSILARIQSAVDAKDADALIDLFDDTAVLVGTAGHGRRPEEVREYLTAVVAQPGSLSWEWRDVVVFHEGPGAIGFAGFGDIVVADQDGEQRAPIRLTAFAVQSPAGWRLRQFHGSIPAGF